MATPKNEAKEDKELCYCRKCKKFKKEDQFYETTNPVLDSNGKLSICKSCCGDIYNEHFGCHNDIEKALRDTCEDLDVCFIHSVYETTLSHIEKLISQGKRADTVFGYYKSKLSSNVGANSKLSSFRYKDSDFYAFNGNEEDEIDDDELTVFWGTGFSIEDYGFLEIELSNWKQTHKCDNQAELTLLKEICIKILEMRNKRKESGDTSKLLDDLQKIMKTASVDPAKANAASAGKSQDCFGVWIKDIEQFKPAEWYENQEKYKDIDGFGKYLKNYVSRPIENFLTGVRNFLVDDDIDADLDTVDIGNTDEGDSNG